MAIRSPINMFHYFIISIVICNYILFTKLPWPGDSEGNFRSSSQAATCPPVYHTRRRLHTVPFNAERQAGKLWIPIFIVFGLTRPGIEPESTASVADVLSTRPLIGWFGSSRLDLDRLICWIWICRSRKILISSQRWLKRFYMKLFLSQGCTCTAKG